ncbi:MAG TPA: hypothetical protein VF221_18840, partial [Chloroflexota bacterium]
MKNSRTARGLVALIAALLLVGIGAGSVIRTHAASPFSKHRRTLTPTPSVTSTPTPTPGTASTPTSTATATATPTGTSHAIKTVFVIVMENH